MVVILSVADCSFQFVTSHYAAGTFVIAGREIPNFPISYKN